MFNGVNPHSLVILDNYSIHHASGIMNAIEEVGALVHFPLPYSPDFNPIEKMFSRVKTVLKSTATEMDVVNDIETPLLASFTLVNLRIVEAGSHTVEYITE